MPTPTLALCVPAYNAAWCLPRLLTSAAAQETPFDEILVYDDASTDDTAAVAAAHGARVIRGDVNCGCSHGKNVLAEAASADWLHFHDADDDLLPNFSRLARGWMDRSDAPDVVLLSYEYRDQASGALLAVRTYDGGDLRADPVAFVITELITNFGLYKRKSFLGTGGYDLDPLVLFNEDAAMHLRLALAGLTFGAEQLPSVVNYRVGGSMSAAGQARCISAQYHVMRKVATQVPRRHHTALSERLWKIAACAGSVLDWDTADAALALAVQLGGRVPRPAAGSRAFRVVAAVAPRFALHAREGVIRRARPHLRTQP